MNIDNQEKELFDEWKYNVPGFIPDGIIDEKCYLRSSPRVLYLLKEVNGGVDWSLKDYIKAGARAQTWNNIARWQYGIQNIDKDIDWQNISYITDDWRKEQLKSICVVNIKKQSGTTTSDWNQLKKFATENKSYLTRQIQLYSPELIICCGTKEIYSKVLYSQTFETDQITQRGICYVNNSSRTVISYVHPAARIKDSILYYGLMDAVKEILLYTK